MVEVKVGTSVLPCSVFRHFIHVLAKGGRESILARRMRQESYLPAHCGQRCSMARVQSQAACNPCSGQHRLGLI